MQLNLGDKIRELRHKEGRTQEALADALGITSQAVSRWESGGSYPDLEMIPAIANYFGITIDELFGYQADRDRKIGNIIAQIDAYCIPSRSDDAWIDECLGILREALAEFPQNEKLLLKLADTLAEAGWRKHKEWIYYDNAGYLRHKHEVHKKNEYWSEAVKICETLMQTATDNATITKAISILIPLYRNLGEKEKAISFFYFICEDGNLGSYHGKLIELYLYLSRIQWERGYHDEAFVSLDEALHHARALEAFLDGREHAFTTSLVSHVKSSAGSPKRIAEQLPNDWPIWSMPDSSKVEQEIKADPRWDAWVAKTQMP